LLRNEVDNAVMAAQQEIRKKIAEVIEDAKKYSESVPQPEKIPPRDQNIVYYGAPNRGLTADEIAYAPEAPDFDTDADRAMNDKITEMRKLNELFYNGYLLNQCAEISIVKQGEFMAEVTDDFGRQAFCGISKPIYGALSNPQLRTYFTWRTDVRRGVYHETDRSYITLYCYELMNKIGVISAADALGRLLALWEGCREFAGWLDEIMPRWIKDFYAYNDLSEQYPDICSCFPVKSAGFSASVSELNVGNYSDKLDYLMENSSYKLGESVFFNEQTKPLLNGAAEAALTALNKYFLERDISLFKLICGRMKRDYNWTPFVGAYVNLDRMDGFRQVRVSPVERYCVKRGEAALELFEPSPYRGFIGYILKSIESELRKRTGFHHKLTPNIKMVINDFRNRDKLIEAVSAPEFELEIIIAVNAWCDKNGIFPAKKQPKGTEELPPAPVKVDIDVEKLSRIRAESEEIAKKLIVEEPTHSEETISEIADRISGEDFSEKMAEYSEQEEIAPQSEAADGWDGLARSLSARHIAVLRELLRGSAERYCRENNILPETVYEEINTLSLDCVGDVVIEGGEIVQDYEEEIRRLAGSGEV
ncbi:MAG: TerB N-terminal domain-containing protein, partial [Oscillospiraceae bacterium]|nr:TerB N-terminal domain-containing protein [Oscillospiraceae bacterium]